MARPSASAAAAALRACLGVAFAFALLLLLPSSGLPRRALSADESCHDVAPGSDGDRGGGGGYVDYLYLFYCVLGGGRRPFLGYAALAAWLAVLFYLLADTAAVYFCASLEGLARLLGLPPAIAGATLLSLGNGAPDALSAIASFAAGGGTSATVGLSGVLGGAMFVSSAVLGVIAVRLGGQGVAVHRASFFRDAAFLLLALVAVAVVVAVGEVTIWAAAGFASLYIVYVLAVAFTPDRWSRRHDALAEDDHASPATAAVFSELHNVTETKFYTDQEARDPLLPDTAPLLQYYADDISSSSSSKSVFWTVLRVLELPLSLPRRLTIPDASKERWSKPAAVTAATLAPVFLSLLWSHRATGSAPFASVLLGGLAGLALGLIAFLTTDPSAPPTRFLGAWLAGGFAMSVAWAYVIANEVLSLLVSAGTILSVDSAALGVTVLAWGNSVSDLVANVAVASRGGGAQVAVSGCYGGPVFNVLVGLGLSMLLSCWSGYPRPVEIPREPGLYRTLAFVASGLLWAVVMLPRRGMRVDRTLGFGLLVIYFCFLCINISQLKNAR
ncbi:cation/calcium exchanger 1 [Sorghum bicolor]|uniref:Sodium/calcium exchanger membrane region domain-containing protein n=1 Tax=Sorghum bicolor TaxID=4558 RepID=A0A1B6QKM5_SORBI|nr:cation/calcium exchanger 1 [Sorghum bicolor]KXG38473.1 hypothetical protein SORBI_3001G240300 [Sorghum bicolor]|eukprot:XP_002467196.2 cation/calcium exchanger 1 [Sorghum bicolor]